MSALVHIMIYGACIPDCHLMADSLGEESYRLFHVIPHEGMHCLHLVDVIPNS